jgi:hypothetical protein
MLINFLNEIQTLGSTDRERAESLGVSVRTLFYWRNGKKIPPVLRILTSHPSLALAVFSDSLTATQGVHLSSLPLYHELTKITTVSHDKKAA